MATRPASPAEPSDLSGTLIAGRYRVRRTLGRGAIGTVSLCRAVWNDALVAVKVLHPELAARQGAASAFLRAARACAQLDHPNVVSIFESGEDDASSLPYFAMEYVAGRNLARLIAEDWPLSDARVVDIMSQVLRALSRAHALGVLHRDLKLSDILLRQRDAGDSASERVVVSDFGFAPLAAAAQQGSVAPESVPTEALDIHAAGVVLFQLLTREQPFDASDPFEVRMQHRATAAPAWIGEIHPALQAACLKALSKSPDARFQSAAELRTALEVALERASVPRGLPAVRGPTPGAAVSRPATQPGLHLAPHLEVAPQTAQPKPVQPLMYGATARLPRRTSSLAPAERVVTKAPERDVIPKRHAGRWLLAGVALLIAIASGLARVPRSGPWAAARSALAMRGWSPAPSAVALKGDSLAAHRDDAPALGAICKADSQVCEASSTQAASRPASAAVAAEPPLAAVAAEPMPSAVVAAEPPSAAVAAEPPSAAVAAEPMPSVAVAAEPMPSAASAPNLVPLAARNAGLSPMADSPPNRSPLAASTSVRLPASLASAPNPPSPAGVAMEPPPSAASAPNLSPPVAAAPELPSPSAAPPLAAAGLASPEATPNLPTPTAAAPDLSPSAAAVPGQPPSAATSPEPTPPPAVELRQSPPAASASGQLPPAASAPIQPPLAASAPGQSPSAASAPIQPPLAAAAPVPAALTPVEPAQPPAASADSASAATGAASQAASAVRPLQARISFGATFTPRGLSRLSLRDVIDQNGLTECYRAALRAGSSANAAFDARLDIETAKGRRITYASLRGPQLPTDLKACVERVALGSRLPSPVVKPLALSATLTFQAP